MQSQVDQYCAEIGADSLLVQGPGGNVSWKQGDVLHIKASGMWLADAQRKQTFVPVDLVDLKGKIADGNFGAKPLVLGTSPLRPSIETMFHALMPQTFVVHVHAVEALAHLVRSDFQHSIAEALGDDLSWTWTGYYQPGPKLAAAVRDSLAKEPDASLVFLQNHGLIVAGQSIEETDECLRIVIRRLAAAQPRPTEEVDVSSADTISDFSLVPAPAVQELALDPELLDRTEKYWALYPDHIVFLGTNPVIFNDVQTAAHDLSRMPRAPEIFFVRGCGVYQTSELSAAKQAYLQCYAEVLRRQPSGALLHGLTDDEVAELFGWEAETYRQQLDKSREEQGVVKQIG